MRQIAANCGNATDAQEKIREADAVAFISPVYWEELSEGLKSFMDRFRRCESSGIFNQRQAALIGKPVLIVASAGGSGLDMIEPLKEMERFVHHTGGRVFDAIGINRWNQAYKGNMIYEAAKAMATGVTVGETMTVHSKDRIVFCLTCGDGLGIGEIES